MKIHLCLYVMLFLPFLGHSQENYLSRLPIRGWVRDLGISPAGEIWMPTAAGNIYYTRQFGDLWNLGPFGSFDPFDFEAIKGTFERINFFSEDTLMISGYIHDDGKEDFVYWSGDHGRTWEKVRFGESSWIDATCITKNGKAWMSGSSQLIYYSEDRGKTWKTFDKVDSTSNLRFSAIHFADDEQTGLFGSHQGYLYRTNDNCLHWELLPTPLSQGKIQLISEEENPNINKLRVVENNYLLKQNGKVFMSDADSIDWKPLPHVIDFEVSESGKIYALSKDLTISLYDSAFVPVWKSEASLSESAEAIAVKNDRLFVITRENLYRISPSQFQKAPLLTDQIPIQEPYLKVEYQGKKWGFSNHDILQFDEERGKWYRAGDAGFPVSNATVLDGKLVIADESLKQYYHINEDTKAIKKYELPQKLFHPDSNKVIAFQLEKASQGCFHSWSTKKLFIRKNDRFVLNRDSSDSKFLGHIDKSIDAQFINQLVEALDKSRFTCLSVSDLNLTEKDIQAFKKFIDTEEKRIRSEGYDKYDFTNLYAFPGENTDFDFYRKTADGLFDLSDDVIDSVFWQAYGNWSTTTDWRKIEFTFEDGKKLGVQNTDDMPNYFYTPWVVFYDGLVFKSNSIRFGRLLEQLTNKKFFYTPVNENNYAIFKIADYLYRQKMKE